MIQTDPTTALPLLTVAIPTYNRSAWLDLNLRQLHSELRGIDQRLVEVIVSDNCSTDSTAATVAEATERGLSTRYIRNTSNVGWALNFAQCFDCANGKYVLMLGDDDLFVDGALGLLLDRLDGRDFGVVCMRPFGFEVDFRSENPGGAGKEREFVDANDFIVSTSRYFTLTSACVINKRLLTGVDSREFATSDLAVFHLYLKAALAGPSNLYIEKYLIASKRQNSFSYDYAVVFVTQLWRILDAHVPRGLTPATIRRLERDKLLSYYPFYLFDLRVSGRGEVSSTRQLFADRFEHRWLFRIWLAPILDLPRPLAILWGAMTATIGRIAAGDLRRGVKFTWSRIARLPARRGSRGHSLRENPSKP